MSVDVTTLEIRVISDAVEKATKRLDDLEKRGASSEKSMGALGGAFAELAVTAGAALSVMEGFEKLVEVTRQFDVLNAGLITATGSSEKAAVAFDAIQKFAAATPYDLQQVTGAFTKLVNYGLNPSEKAMTAYGNTASAMGKSLDQMVEAVADAATGEFERLKEFGIRASKQGDDIKFSFRGVETTVKATTDNIQQYLIGLGENNFAGAMAQRMNSLDGALSNLGDSWDQLFLKLSQEGAGDVITKSVNQATNALNSLTASLASGQIDGYLAGLKAKFEGFGSDISTTFHLADEASSNFILDAKNNLERFLSETLAEISRFPNDFRSWIQAAVVESVASIQELGSEFQALYEKTKAVFTDDTIDAAQQRNLDRLREIHKVRADSLDWIIKERDTQISALGQEIEKADQAKQKYIELNQAKSGGDALAGFQVSGDGSSVIGGSSKTKKPAKKKGPDDGAASVQNLEYELSQEDELISSHMQKRFETRTAWDAINDQAMTTSFSRKMEQWALEDASKQEYLDREYQQNQDHFIRVQNQLNDWYNKEKITKDKFDQLTLANTKKFNTQKEQLDKASHATQLSNSAIYAGAALNILTTLFANNKPIAIAAALVSTYQGATNALATLPYPANIAAAGTVVAAGMAQVHNIMSTNVGSSGGGGGGGGGVSSSMPTSTITDLTSSTLPATAQKETPVTRTIYLAQVTGGNEFKDSDLLKYSSLRELAEAINEESKLGTIKLVI